MLNLAIGLSFCLFVFGFLGLLLYLAETAVKAVKGKKL